MKNINDKTLALLPKVFQDDTGKVNLDLMKQIFSVIPRASGEIRNLLQHLCNIKLPSKDDPFCRLAIKLPSSEFREQWYRTAKAKKGKIPAPLYIIVDTWIHQRHKNLGVSSQAFEQFFEKRLEKRYPRLDKIGILSDQLISTATEALPDSALFAWSMIERIHWNSVTNPKEKSLTHFRDVLLNNLRERGANDLLAQLEDGDFLPDDTGSLNEHLPKESNEHKPPNIDSTETTAENQDPIILKKLNGFFVNKIHELDDLVEQTKTEHRRAIALANGTFTCKDSIKEIKKTIESMERLHNHVLKADEAATELENGVAEIIAESLQPLCISLVPKQPPLFSIATSEEWKRVVAARHVVANNVLQLANTLTKFDRELIRNITSCHKENEIELENAAQYLAIIKDEATLLSHGLAAKQTIQKILEEKQEDFSWNPILDTNIPDECWIHVGEYLVAMQGSMPRVLGVCIRKHFRQLQIKVAGFLDKVLTRADIPLEVALDVVTSMSLGQIEEIKCDSEEGKTFLAVVELESFLLIADLCSTDLFPTDAYEFLSAKPLSDYLSEHGSTVTERFFRSAFEALNIDGNGRLTINELRRLVTIAELHHLISLENPAPWSNQKSFHELLMKNLLEALEFHPGGGQTYAQLWEIAYMKICQPLKDIANKGTLEDAAKYYRDFRLNFDIEGHLNSWKSSIPDRLRKQSQYEKKLRLMVQSKLEALDDWLNSYESTESTLEPPTSDDSVARLKSAISDVFSAKDPGSNLLIRWFQTLSKGDACRSSDLITPKRSLESNFSETLHQRHEDALHPRVFLAIAKGAPATVADFLADEIFLSFGLNTAEKLAELYANQKCYEAFEALSLTAPEKISVDIERRVEAAIEDLESQYLSRIENIESKANTLDQSASELIASDIVTIRNHINNQHWAKVGSCLEDVERSINAFLREEENNRLAKNLLTEIKALGESVPDTANLHIIQAAHENAVEKSRSRRQHIECLTRIVGIEVLDPALKEEVLATVSALGRPESLPSADRSAEVAYVFGETVAILGDQIRRSKNFVPAYTQKLNFLTSLIAKCLRLHGVNDGSPTISLLVESESDWQGIPDGEEEVIERLLNRFSGTDYSADLASLQKNSPEIVPASVPQALTTRHDTKHSQESFTLFTTYVDRLAGTLARIGNGIDGIDQYSTTTLGREKLNNRLPEAAILARDLFEKCADKRSPLALAHLTDWAISMLKDNFEMVSVEDYAAGLHMINRFQGTASVRALLATKRNSKSRLGEMTARFLFSVSKVCGLTTRSNLIEQIQDVSDNINLIQVCHPLFIVAFSPVGENDSLTARSLWDSLSGDTRQAEARAALMSIFWQTSAQTALACCLKYINQKEIDGRTADALANIAEQALSKGRVDLLQSYVDLRRTVSAKPFQIFVGLLLSKMPTKSDPPAQISLVGSLEHNINEQYSLNGILSIKPRRSDSPNSISLRLPQTSPVLFDSGVSNKILKGPFIDEEILLPINFRLRNQDARDFSIQVDCEATSITGIASSFAIRLDFAILGVGSYTKIPAEDIEEAFQQFPHSQMRGTSYIHRPDDERRIENDLFKSKTIRSLWISSPRRSGKTTMLYRILDAYSHKIGRDNLIAYFSLNKSFDTTTIFNDWLWKTLKNSADNSELRDLYPNFSDIGRDLPHDADVGTFVETMADRLVTLAKPPASRIIFLFDEIDKLATMFFEGGARKDTAIDIAWQLRQLIGRRRDIGFVFAGSSAAKKIFLTNQDAPFFNTGIHFELSKFSCQTQAKEDYARQIIEPPRLRGRLTIPRASLERMLWICSGIPYYMKLLAGATYAVTRQSQVLESDVNEGLHALLEKRTGIRLLDEVEGDPGSDELRTIALEKGEDRLLTQAVLYAVAELESPLSGHPIRRARLYGESSPLSTRYKLPRHAIERGLDRAIELGLLKRSDDTPPQISYAIPILGESIRNSCGSYWAEIDHQLEQLGNELREAIQ